MTHTNTDQQNLINFATDPTVIAAAVEGSMEKRRAVLDDNVNKPETGDATA